MVQANRGIVAATRHPGEHRVGGPGAGHVHPLGPQLLDGGHDQNRFLVSQRPLLPGVRVEAGDGQTGMRDTEVAHQRRMGGARGGGDQLRRQHRDGVAQRHVHGDRHHPQQRAGQHHDFLARHAGERRQELGMAGIGEPRGIQRRFVDGIGDHRTRLQVQRHRDRSGDRPDDLGRVGRVRIARPRRVDQRHRDDRQRVGEHPRRGLGIRHRHDRHVQAQTPRQFVEMGRIVERNERITVATGQPRAQGALPADAGGIAHGQRERPNDHRPEPLTSPARRPRAAPGR